MIKHKLVAAVLIASMILTSPGPWLYSAFAQGSSGRRIGVTPALGHEAAPGANHNSLDFSETPLSAEDLAMPKIETPLLEEAIRTDAVDVEPNAASRAETKAPPIQGALRQDAANTAASSDRGAGQAKITYDGAVLEPGDARDAVALVEGAKVEPRLGRAPSPRPASVPSVGRLSPHAGHDHDARPAGWKTWALRGTLVTAAIAAVVLGKVSMGIVPLAFLSAGVIGSIVAHELAHMVALKALGDDTAKKRGHDGLNPFQHVSFWNTIVTPIATLTASLGFFHLPLVAGAAKPIEADFNRLHDPKADPFWVSLAGPAANGAIALLAFGAAFALPQLGLIAAGTTAAVVLSQLAWTNVALGAFNLFVPLPGFDGGKILVRFLPKRLYDLWTHNPRLPASYQSTYRKLYEGPANLLSRLGIENQRQVNRLTWGMNVAVIGGLYLASLAWIGSPVVFLVLACAYDYYCIREKIQNEDAVTALIDILQDFTSELAKAAEEDDSIQSVINQEEVEHVMKNVLEDIIDQVIDSQGFNELTDDQKWERFTGVYTDAAVKALKEKGMSEDDPSTIRRVLTQTPYGQRFFNRMRAEFIDRFGVWEKWHSPKRKTKNNQGAAETGEKHDKHKSAGGSTMLSVAALGILGASLFGMAGGDILNAAAMLGAGAVIGNIHEGEGAGVPKVKTFEESVMAEEMKFSQKEQAFLLMILKEMKLESKPPIIGRVDEMNDIDQHVTAPRGDINSVVLIGESGVGKTAVVEKLAQTIALSEASGESETFRLEEWGGRFLVQLNLGELLLQDNPAQALNATIKLLQRFNDSSKKSGAKVILFIDEIHQLFLHQQGPQIANLIKDVLRNGELTLITATTRKEYKKYMEADEAFQRRLIPIWVDEYTVEQSLRALQGAKGYYEDLYDVKFTPESMRAAAEDSKVDQELFLPGRAFDYMRFAARANRFPRQRRSLSNAIEDKIGELRYVMQQLQEDLSTTALATENLKKDKPSTIDLYNWAVKLSNELVELHRRRDGVPKSGIPVITREMVHAEITKKTKVSSGQLTLGQEPMDRYLEMEDKLNEIVVGQREAIHVVSEAVKMNKAGLALNPEEPIGTFYMTGPTGSGKSYFVKQLADYLKMNLIRLDMSEYMHDHEVAKLQGSPPGYVGFEAGGQLTEKVRRNPYSVILWDEIEKAHPAVFLMMLQILGEGRLTDGQGRTVYFNNTLNIMTSNLGMGRVNELLGKYLARYKDLKAQLHAAGENAAKRAELEAAIIKVSEDMAADMKQPTQEITEEEFRRFPPEFQGRFTAPPLVFNRIDHPMALKIVDLELKKLKKVLERAGNQLEWTPQAVKNLTIEGFDPTLGARPLNNTIKRMVIQPIANEILKAAVKNKGRGASSLIKVNATANGGLRIEVKELPPKQVSKNDAGEGAEQELFSKVLETVVSAVANHTSPSLGTGEIDAWIKAAVANHTQASEAPPAQAAAPEASKTEEAKSVEVAPSAPAPVAKTASFKADVALDLGPEAKKFVAETYKPKKDSGVQHVQRLLAEALDANGYPQEVKEALLRAAADKDTPFVGALKLFVEQAKTMGKDDQSKPIQLAFELDDHAVRLLVHRNGRVGEKEAAMLKRHFTGPVLNSDKARVQAEIYNVQGKDGRKAYFDLYRALSAFPGARVGWATGANALGGSGTDYWVEIPKPEPKPEPPAAPPAPPEETASAAPSPVVLSPEETAKLERWDGVIPDSQGSEVSITVRWGGEGDSFSELLSSLNARLGIRQYRSFEGLHYLAAPDVEAGAKAVLELLRRSEAATVSAHGSILDKLGVPSAAAPAAEHAPPGPETASAIGGPAAEGLPEASDPRLSKISSHPHGSGPEDPHWIELQIPQSLVHTVARPLLFQLGLQWRGTNGSLDESANAVVNATASSLQETVEKALRLAAHSQIIGVRLHSTAYGFLTARANEASPAAAAPPVDPRSAKLKEDATLNNSGSALNRKLSFDIRIGFQGLDAAYRHFAEPLLRELGIEHISHRWVGNGKARIVAEAASPFDAVQAAVWLAGHSQVLAVGLPPVTLATARERIAGATGLVVPPTHGGPRTADAAPEPKLQASGWEGELRNRVHVRFRVRAGESLETIRGRVLPQLREMGLTMEPGDYLSDDEHLAHGLANNPAAAASIGGRLAAMDEVVRVKLHPETLALVEQPASGDAPSGSAAAPADPETLTPNDARAAKLQELPAAAQGANAIFWIDLRPSGDTTGLRLPDMLPAFVRPALARLGIELQDTWLEAFTETEPPMLRIRGFAPTAELASIAALELARHAEVTAAFLHETALALARSRPATLGPADGRLVKIGSATREEAPTADGAKILWFDYLIHPEPGLPDGGAVNGEILPLLERLGLDHKVHQWHEQRMRVQAEAPNVQEAVNRALELAADPKISEITLHPIAWNILQSRIVRTPDQDLSAQERHTRFTRIHELPESRHVGPDDVILLDLNQQIPGKAGGKYLLDNFITPVFRTLGLSFTEGAKFYEGPPRVYRANGRAVSAEAAALAALDLAGRSGVLQVLAHPNAIALLRQRLFGSPEGGPTVQAAISYHAAGSGRGSGSGTPNRAASQARDTLRKFLYALLGQGDARSPGVRNAAADALAAVSNEGEDLEKARTDWIRFEQGHSKYPQIEAAAMIIARRGGGAEDLARLLRAVQLMNSNSGHTYNPPKRRLAVALAKLLQAAHKPQALGQKLKEEKDKTWGSSTAEADADKFKNDVRRDAFYLAAARSGDASARAALLDSWSLEKTPWLHEYMARVDPAHMRKLYQDWKSTGKPPAAAGFDRGLTPYAIADHGTIEDLEAFTNMMESTWNDYGELQSVIDAYASFVKRVGGFGRIREKMHNWMHSLNTSNHARALVAIAATGENGTADDIAVIEKLMRENPDNVEAFHEMSQHEAAIAWAKIAARNGLMDKFLTAVLPAPAGQRNMTRIVAMLSDRNAIFNKAALSAIRLHFGGEDDFGI